MGTVKSLALLKKKQLATELIGFRTSSIVRIRNNSVLGVLFGVGCLLCVLFLCTVFRLIVVLSCVMCVACVLCLIVVPLPQGETPFAVEINNKLEDKLMGFRTSSIVRILDN
jgi:hypothetical protein